MVGSAETNCLSKHSNPLSSLYLSRMICSLGSINVLFEHLHCYLARKFFSRQLVTLPAGSPSLLPVPSSMEKPVRVQNATGSPSKSSHLLTFLRDVMFPCQVEGFLARTFPYFEFRARYHVSLPCGRIFS